MKEILYHLKKKTGYEKIVFDAAVKTAELWDKRRPLDLDYILEGHDVALEERLAIVDFAEELYARFAAERKRSESWLAETQTSYDALFVARLGTAAVIGGAMMLLTDNLLASYFTIWMSYWELETPMRLLAGKSVGSDYKYFRDRINKSSLIEETVNKLEEK